MFSFKHPKPIQKNGPDVVQVVQQNQQPAPSMTTIVIEKKDVSKVVVAQPPRQQ
jgi:hypothetical protein